MSPNGKGFMEVYEANIINMRNALAHCQSIEIESDGTEILKTRKGDITFSADDFIKIRKDIVTYHSLFDNILNALVKK